MLKITITQKDIEKNSIQYTDSNYIIDELAYSVGSWTSNDLYDNNIDYEPSAPYNFDYESDLFEHTQTYAQYSELCKRLEIETSINGNWKPEANNNLQCGAFLALNYPDHWNKLLTFYTQALKEQAYNDDQELYSEKYAKDLETEKQSFYDDLYNEWLHGDRSDVGVVYKISKYYTENGGGEWNQKDHSYIFMLDDYDISYYKDRTGYKKNQMKRAIIEAIQTASVVRADKEERERKARAEEYQKTKAYKEERARLQEEARKEKLLSMILN